MVASLLAASVMGAFLTLRAGGQDFPKEPTMSSLKLESAAFAPDQNIPRKYTCEGANVAPPLSWSGVPAGTKSLALIVDDPDAPDPAAPKRVWVHWVLYNVPSHASGVPEGAKVPAGTLAGKNDFGTTAYGGPCPPVGRHRYIHKLYALDTVLEGLNEPDKAKLEAAMKGHILGEAKLVGMYQKEAH